MPGTLEKLRRLVEVRDDRIRDLETQITQLRCHLGQYGRHLESCLRKVPRVNRDSSINYDECDCGFDAALLEAVKDMKCSTEP